MAKTNKKLSEHIPNFKQLVFGQILTTIARKWIVNTEPRALQSPNLLLTTRSIVSFARPLQRLSLDSMSLVSVSFITPKTKWIATVLNSKWRPSNSGWAWKHNQKTAFQFGINELSNSHSVTQSRSWMLADDTSATGGDSSSDDVSSVTETETAMGECFHFSKSISLN